MKNLIITGRNLTKSYDGIHNILSDVNIEIEAGSKNLIIGKVVVERPLSYLY